MLYYTTLRRFVRFIDKGKEGNGNGYLFAYRPLF